MQKFNKENYDLPAKKFKALGHPLRLWIAYMLMDSEHCVQELAEQTDVDFSTVSQHLAALKEADILSDEKRGKQVFYRLKCDCVRQFLSCVAKRHQLPNSNSNETII